MRDSSLHIVADENIPLVEEAFGAFGDIVLLPGRQITQAAVQDADVLLVRSVTKVDQALLEGSRVRCVGTATIGTDHLDVAYLAQCGIVYAHAPGSNAESVVEYVLAALISLGVRGRTLRGRTIGIVGCGNIGGALAERVPALGMKVLLNDPPLARAAVERGAPHPFVPLDLLLGEADVVTLHVPYKAAGPQATHHLIGQTQLQQMKKKAWLLNTCRGAVVSNDALKSAVATGQLGATVLDVWEGEPTPDLELLSQVDLATPHIAGYSYDGKVQGTIMLYQALTAFWGTEETWDYEAALASSRLDRLRLTPPSPATSEPQWMHEVVRQMYDIEADDERFRRMQHLHAGQRGAYFSELRKHYPRRRAFPRHRLARCEVPEAYRGAVRGALRISMETA